MTFKVQLKWFYDSFLVAFIPESLSRDASFPQLCYALLQAALKPWLHRATWSSGTSCSQPPPGLTDLLQERTDHSRGSSAHSLPAGNHHDCQHSSMCETFSWVCKHIISFWNKQSIHRRIKITTTSVVTNSTMSSSHSPARGEAARTPAALLPLQLGFPCWLVLLVCSNTLCGPQQILHN